MGIHTDVMECLREYSSTIRGDGRDRELVMDLRSITDLDEFVWSLRREQLRGEEPLLSRDVRTLGGRPARVEIYFNPEDRRVYTERRRERREY